MTSHTGKSIIIADYDPARPARFEAERARIFAASGRDAFVDIEHVGSTSVPGLAAKPIIDMMPGLRSLDDAPPVIATLETLGFEYVPAFELETASGPGMPDRRYFRRDIDGERVFHVHMVEAGGEFWTAHLLFRDYLRAFPAVAEEYGKLKRKLAFEFNLRLTPTSDINIGYTDRKTEFIEGAKAAARRWRGRK